MSIRLHEVWGIGSVYYLLEDLYFYLELYAGLRLDLDHERSCIGYPSASN